jgi:hypothetical protein
LLIDEVFLEGVFILAVRRGHVIRANFLFHILGEQAGSAHGTGALQLALDVAAAVGWKRLVDQLGARERERERERRENRQNIFSGRVELAVAGLIH